MHLFHTHFILKLEVYEGLISYCGGFVTLPLAWLKGAPELPDCPGQPS